MSDAGPLETTPDADEALGAAGGATLLADLVETLLPGEGAWPSGRDAGVQHPLSLRLIEERGRNALPGQARGGPRSAGRAGR